MEVQTTHQPGVMPTGFPMESFNQSVIKHKTGLLNLAADLGNISKACRMMGFSRDTFYCYQAAHDAGGIEALFEVSRKKPNLKIVMIIQELLLVYGLAWIDERFYKRPECEAWRLLERPARLVGRGIWKNPQPIPPWKWRRGER